MQVNQSQDPSQSPAPGQALEQPHTHQLAVAQPSLGGPGAGAPLDPLLLALGGPGGEHGGVDGQGGLPEVLVLQPVLGRDPPRRVIRQEAAKEEGKRGILALPQTGNCSGRWLRVL